jgi:hypothetical protein
VKRAALLTAALCAGCSHSQVYVDNSGSSSSSTQSSVQAHARSGSDFFTLLGLTIVAATIVDMERESARLRDDPLWSRNAPPLASDRVVAEHDCTRPIAEYAGNLRCR